MNIHLTHNKLHIMHDLETTGTKPGCPVLSIGAVVMFDRERESHTFYMTVSRQSCLDHGLVDDPATLAWWDKQPAGAREAAFSGEMSLPAVLNEYHDWLNLLAGPRTICVWGNGASFDSPVLAAAYRAAKMVVPWDFRDEYCYRTMKNLYPMIPFIPPPVKHHALYDALAQANHLERIGQFLSARGGI